MHDPYVLFHLSDIHFGLEDPRALDWVKQEISKKRPDAVAITGDLTMRARLREFDAACAWIRALDAPVTVGVGNHDLPYFNPIQRFFDPYQRIQAIADKVEVDINLPGLAIVPLKTVARWQPRLNWSKGCVTDAALAHCLAALDALPKGTCALITAHHPLREVGTKGTALTINGQKSLTELAKRKVLAVLSGHVHDAFDLTEQTAQGPVRMIGAGTLSRRLRSTPPSFNELRWDGEQLSVTVRNLGDHATPDMMIGDVPEDATPPRSPLEPVAPVEQVPDIKPPVH
ncbi:MULTISPECIES: metallophosphoesterase family protein [Thiorhodovibrio]|uniref:metallophosphoesterase family protein n=1 Tax=Thiorhodovibrio TaxID=61593 RepID=UPI001911D529|nr:MULTISPECIES: metallophosphoesterase [Thiorhodovibrio]MBK5967849.1 metallophosphoesterase [Thiorhodovibrio winogradskyi]WPL14074.1 Calcineurin-like phosphoesterase [Thiorhodovibrio litoralis]